MYKNNQGAAASLHSRSLVRWGLPVTVVVSIQNAESWKILPGKMGKSIHKNQWLDQVARFILHQHQRGLDILQALEGMRD